MRNHLGGERLSWGDTVFLNLERSGMPLNVACISLFDGDIVFEDYLRFVESRLPLIPRYLMRVVPPPLNAGLPTWEYDPDFDIRTHVREATLKHGSIAELKARDDEGTVLVHGGPDFAKSLTRLGLIDEYQLTTVPIAIGAGRSPRRPFCRRPGIRDSAPQEPFLN